MSIILKSGSSENLADVSIRKALVIEDVNEIPFTGAYSFNSGVMTISTSAHTVNVGGFFWMFNYVGSGKIMRIHKMRIMSSPSATTSFIIAPRLTFSFMTVSGTPSGTEAYPVKYDSTYPWTSMDIRTTSTGLTFIYGYPLFVSFPPTVLTGVGVSNTVDSVWESHQQKCDIILREGEGIVFWQQDNGSNSDTRRILTEVSWVET